jgi:hypothetical protein
MILGIAIIRYDTYNDQAIQFTLYKWNKDYFKWSLHLCQLHTWGQGAQMIRVSLDMPVNKNNKISLSGLKSWPSCSRKWMSLVEWNPCQKCIPSAWQKGICQTCHKLSGSPTTNSECCKLVVSEILPHNSPLPQLFVYDTQFPVTIRSYKIHSPRNNSAIFTHFNYCKN